jgi:hypothetical protein
MLIAGVQSLKVLLRAAGSGDGTGEPRRQASRTCLDPIQDRKQWFRLRWWRVSSTFISQIQKSTGTDQATAGSGERHTYQPHPKVDSGARVRDRVGHHPGCRRASTGRFRKIYIWSARLRSHSANSANICTIKIGACFITRCFRGRRPPFPVLTL